MLSISWVTRVKLLMFKSQLYTSCIADEGRESKTSLLADFKLYSCRYIYIFYLLHMVISNAKVMGRSNLPILWPILSSKFYSIPFCKHFWPNQLGPNFSIFHFWWYRMFANVCSWLLKPFHGTNYVTSILDPGESPLPPLPCLKDFFL